MLGIEVDTEWRRTVLIKADSVDTAEKDYSSANDHETATETSERHEDAVEQREDKSIEVDIHDFKSVANTIKDAKNGTLVRLEAIAEATIETSSRVSEREAREDITATRKSSMVTEKKDPISVSFHVPPSLGYTCSRRQQKKLSVKLESRITGESVSAKIWKPTSPERTNQWITVVHEAIQEANDDGLFEYYNENDDGSINLEQSSMVDFEEEHHELGELFFNWCACRYEHAPVEPKHHLLVKSPVNRKLMSIVLDDSLIDPYQSDDGDDDTSALYEPVHRVGRAPSRLKPVTRAVRVHI